VLIFLLRLIPSHTNALR